MQSVALLAISIAFAASPYPTVPETEVIGYADASSTPIPAAAQVGFGFDGYGGTGYEPVPLGAGYGGGFPAYGSVYDGDRYWGGYGCDACHHCGGYCGHRWGCLCPPHDMYPHIPYRIACSDYYYFRPYNAVHYGQIQAEAVQWGAPAHLPYSREVFERVNAQMLIELTGGVSPSDAAPVGMPLR